MKSKNPSYAKATEGKQKSKIEEYNPSSIEAKWLKKWEEEKIYSPNLGTAKKPFYNLMMFPYPSAEGLHVGNVYAFTGADTYGRFKRMQGHDVFEPMGLDGFGIHSENYALKVGRHPKEQAKRSEENFYRQLRLIGNGFDWSRKLETYDPQYYKWTQWIFIQLFKRGLAYRKKAPVNFCPKDLTVLADEQVIDGKCERCGSVVEKRELEQWFFRITQYADRLLNNIKDLNWTEKVKIAQKEWIGRKEGIKIKYDVILNSFQDLPGGNREMLKQVQHDKKVSIEVFTTAPVNFGMTFLVVSPEYDLAKKIVEGKISVPQEKLPGIKVYVETYFAKRKSAKPAEEKTKTGVFTGLYAINQINNKEVPIWISDFVLMEVGTGAVQGCPGHDYNDFEFATKYKLPIPRVIVGPDGDMSQINRREQVIEKGMKGKFVNSEFLNGLDFEEGLQKTMDYFEEKGWGKRVVTYHLRDWLISRQRYWGPPIPMIYCEKPASPKTASRGGCGWQPVPDDQLPVLLPEVEDWKPKGEGSSPLANIPEFVNTTCPHCGSKARRETDVSDTFLDSAWYFFRYLATEWQELPFPMKKNEILNQVQDDMEKRLKWLPVTMYIGGAEHSVLHLLYSRFITMVFKDMGLIDFEEPYARFYAHGLIIKDGAKMSKSKGNVINPDEYLEKYGADTLRAYLRFVGPFDMGGDFRDSGIEGMQRFLKRVWKLANVVILEGEKRPIGSSQKDSITSFQNDIEGKRMMHKTIKGITEDLENLRFNTAMAKLMTWYNYLSEQKEISKEELKIYIQLLAPFAPFLTEELYQHVISSETRDLSPSVRDDNIFQSVHTSKWPSYDEKYLVSSEIVIAVQINGKTRATLRIKNQELRSKNKKIEELARKSERIQKYLEGKKIEKTIYIEGKVINFVIK